MTATRGEWAKDFAVALGNDNPSASTIDWIAAWTKAEGTKARFNPLATTLDLQPNTKFNSVGVRNYQSRSQGVQASVQTLEHNFPGYADIREGIRTNKPALAQRGIMVAPWGTNGTTVGIYWQHGGIAGEQLLSEAEGGPENAAPPNAGAAPSPTPSGGRQPETQPHGPAIPPSYGRRLAYVLVGGGCLAVALSLAIRRYVPTRQIVETIAAAA